MPTENENILIAVEWLWERRGKNLWWRAEVLGKQNPDPSSPKLTDVGAICVFNLLLDKGLMIRAKNTSGNDVFVMQEAKVREWEELIAELKWIPTTVSPPPKHAGDGEGNSRTDNDSSQKDKKIGIAEIMGGIVFVAIGCGCTEVEAHFFALVFYWLSAACGIDGLIRLCEWTSKTNWILQIITFIVFAGLFVWHLKNGSKPELPKPHFHLSFITPDSSGQNSILDLTNECISCPFGGAVFGKTIGVLNIPIREERWLSHSNFSEELLFDVCNDTVINGEYPEVLWEWTSPRLRFPLSTGWDGIVPIQGFSDALAFSPLSAREIAHFEAKRLPTMKCDNINMDFMQDAYGEAFVTIKQTAAPDIRYSFIIRFLRDSNMCAYISEFTKSNDANVFTIEFPPRPNAMPLSPLNPLKTTGNPN
jgi:hypothetical protein